MNARGRQLNSLAGLLLALLLSVSVGLVLLANAFLLLAAGAIRQVLRSLQRLRRPSPADA
jgi:hypothetical protein